MSDSNVFLDAFPSWLKTLATDVNELGALLRNESLPEDERRYIAGSINYLFKSLDLIPDGIEDLGFIDDAFVLRVAAKLAQSAASDVSIRRLASESSLIAEFLGADYARLETYVKGLTRGAARGRTVDEILGDSNARDSFLSDVASWVAGYEAPTFSRDEKTLVKLRSFLDTKLPR